MIVLGIDRVGNVPNRGFVDRGTCLNQCGSVCQHFLSEIESQVSQGDVIPVVECLNHVHSIGLVLGKCFVRAVVIGLHIFGLCVLALQYFDFGAVEVLGARIGVEDDLGEVPKFALVEVEVVPSDVFNKRETLDLLVALPR